MRKIPLYILITTSLVNAVIFIVGTIGNVFVIFVVIKVRNMRTPANIFLLNLSAADFLVLLICQPAGLLEFFGQDEWFYGDIICLVFEELVTALKERFAPPNQTELHRVQLRERRQKATETLSELAQDIRRLTNLAYPTASNDVRETLAKEQFVDSLLSSDMRLRIKQARPANTPVFIFLGKLVSFMENGVLHVSILTMLVVTFKRYHAICHPLKHQTASTISDTVKVIVGIWITGTILTSPFLIMTEYEDAMFNDESTFKVCRTKGNEEWRYCYTIFIFVAFFAFPVFLLICFYTCIIRQLMSDKLKSLAENNKTALNVLNSRKQVVQILIFIIVLFFVSLLPIRVVSLWLIFTPTMSKVSLAAYLNLVSWVRILMCINSAGNPIIYSLTSTKFKNAFKRILGRNRLKFRFNVLMPLETSH